MRARDIMASPVVTVRPDTHVKDAAVLLASHGFTALPVVDDDERLIGIVSEADLVRDRIPRDPRHRMHGTGPPQRLVARPTVGEVMSAPVTTMGPGADVAELAAALLSSGHRCMPIVEDSRVVGVVSRGDLVRVVGREDGAIAKDVLRKLEIYGGPGRWQVEVHDGVVTIGDTFDDETDRHVARVIAEAVPGVVSAEVVRRPSE
jgi:CBS-domain-containing membrane protein